MVGTAAPDHSNSTNSSMTEQEQQQQQLSGGGAAAAAAAVGKQQQEEGEGERGVASPDAASFATAATEEEEGEGVAVESPPPQQEEGEGAGVDEVLAQDGVVGGAGEGEVVEGAFEDASAGAATEQEAAEEEEEEEPAVDPVRVGEEVDTPWGVGKIVEIRPPPPLESGASGEGEGEEGGRKKGRGPPREVFVVEALQWRMAGGQAPTLYLQVCGWWSWCGSGLWVFFFCCCWRGVEKFVQCVHGGGHHHTYINNANIKYTHTLKRAAEGADEADAVRHLQVAHPQEDPGASGWLGCSHRSMICMYEEGVWAGGWDDERHGAVLAKTPTTDSKKKKSSCAYSKHI